ncbi:MAG: vitamin K epoxide reductase family protein [Pyrinomonadaceae bacterium]
MNEATLNEAPSEVAAVAKLPVVGAIVALIGLADAAYLAVHHLTAEPVPCTIVAGCETVLTSSYAQIAGVPLAAFGAIAYFLAFALALLTAFGNRTMWTLFGIQVVLMSLFTAWLLYLQGYVIGAFCQFCLISAITTFTMLGVFLASRFTR